MEPRVLLALLLMPLLAGCTEDADDPPVEAPRAYAERLSNATLAYMDIWDVYAEAAKDDFDGKQYAQAAWAFNRSANESAAYMQRVQGPEFNPPPGEVNSYYD